MEKRNKIIYWVATGLLSALMITSATRYLIDIGEFRQYFVAFGYNARIVIPLAIAKLLAVVVILSNKSVILKEWAYAGLLFNFLLALEAHIAINDGQYIGPIIALILWAVSYIFYHKVYRDVSSYLTHT